MSKKLTYWTQPVWRSAEHLAEIQEYLREQAEEERRLETAKTLKPKPEEKKEEKKEAVTVKVGAPASNVPDYGPWWTTGTVPPNFIKIP